MAIHWTLFFALVFSVKETYFGIFFYFPNEVVRKGRNFSYGWFIDIKPFIITVFSSVMLYKFHIKYTHLNVVTVVILVVSPEESHIVARSNSDSVNFYLNLCNPKIKCAF
jgi:L-lactate permease